MYRKQNRALLAAKESERRLLHPEKSSEASRKYAAKNAESVAANSSRYHYENREAIAAKHAEQYRRNKPAAIARAAKHKSRRSNLLAIDASDAAIRAIYEAAARVSSCLKIPFHVDHIIPKAKGGLHHQRNLQILPAVLNIRKGDGPAFVWAAA